MNRHLQKPFPSTDNHTTQSETSCPDQLQNHLKQETSFQIDRLSLQDVARARFRDLLKDTWPGTDRETARRAAKSLNVHEKTVLNWLACTHSAPFEIVFAIGCFTGVYRVMDVMTRGQGRMQVLNLFAKGVRRVLGK
ncbi:hypothetical protein [Pelagimonas varians]|uniref:Uncharacterized protein n=1 Tax=Pelagimonas varians TaxID=696760 RepID=A0A238KDE3_9RHOB|nr:hypothetical protein [Pelagimonas varians]PYG29985.1 hypothetical protein C8N36_107151 [Pelagimonas varians]SMX40567.1 hypothetical protein PEV8663_02044 [Pelagimonas varians]